MGITWFFFERLKRQHHNRGTLETLDAEGEIIRSFNGLQKCRDMWYWLVVWNINFIFPLILGMSNHPHWRTHIFQRGGPTTNQIRWRCSNYRGVPDRRPVFLGWWTTETNGSARSPLRQACREWHAFTGFLCLSGAEPIWDQIIIMTISIDGYKISFTHIKNDITTHKNNSPKDQTDYPNFPHQTCYLRILRVYPICKLWLIPNTIGWMIAPFLNAKNVRITPKRGLLPSLCQCNSLLRNIAYIYIYHMYIWYIYICIYDIYIYICIYDIYIYIYICIYDIYICIYTYDIYIYTYNIIQYIYIYTYDIEFVYLQLQIAISAMWTHLDLFLSLLLIHCVTTGLNTSQ